MNLSASTAAAILETLKPLVAEAGSWDDADWTHGFNDDGDGTCEGGHAGDGCQTCIDASLAAENAQKAGAEALEALAKGDAEEALRCLAVASSEERQFGDDPSWSKPRKALRAALEALLDTVEGLVGAVEEEVDEEANEAWNGLLDAANAGLEALGLDRSSDGGLLFKRGENRLVSDDVEEADAAIADALRMIERVA